MAESERTADRTTRARWPPAGHRVRGRAAGTALAVRRGRGVPAAAGQGGVRAPVRGGPPAAGRRPVQLGLTRARVVRERHLDGAAARRDHRGQPAPHRGPLRRPRGAGRPRLRPPVHYTELLDAVEALAAGLVAAGVRKGDRVGIWAPNRWEWVILQYATADMGAILVNINPAYRTHELEYVLNQAGHLAAGGGAGVQDQRLPGDGRRGARPVPAAAVGGLPRRPGLGVAVDRRPVGAAGDPGRAELRRPDQHPVHVRDHRVPEGCDALAPQHPQQRLLRRRAAARTPRRTGSASRCPSTTASAW